MNAATVIAILAAVTAEEVELDADFATFGGLGGYTAEQIVLALRGATAIEELGRSWLATTPIAVFRVELFDGGVVVHGIKR